MIGFLSSSVIIISSAIHFSFADVINKDTSGGINRPFGYPNYPKQDLFTLSMKTVFPYGTESQNQAHVAEIYGKIAQLLHDRFATNPNVLECGQTYNDNGHLGIRFRAKYQPDKCNDFRTLAATAVRLFDEIQSIEASCGYDSVSFF